MVDVKSYSRKDHNVKKFYAVEYNGSQHIVVAKSKKHAKKIMLSNGLLRVWDRSKPLGKAWQYPLIIAKYKIIRIPNKKLLRYQNSRLGSIIHSGTIKLINTGTGRL